MFRKLIQPVVLMAIMLAPMTAMSAQNDDIHRQITEGKIAAAQVIYLEAEIFSAEALLEREIAKMQTMNISDQEGKIVASMINVINHSLDKARTDLDNSSIENGTDLSKVEKEIEEINELISEINS
jgi:hypothetical protein